MMSPILAQLQAMLLADGIDPAVTVRIVCRSARDAAKARTSVLRELAYHATLDDPAGCGIVIHGIAVEFAAEPEAGR